MLRNYVTIALRNLMRNKVFSSINIVGLAVGITCFILLILFVFDEMGYDSFNEKADRIYRVYISSDVNGNASNTSKTAAPLGETLKREYPEVQNYARLGYFGVHELKYKDKLFVEGDIYTADSTYFKIFTLPLIYGDPNTALIQPNSIILSEKAANKYFGTENPLGKQFIVDDTLTYNITGVMKNYPKDSHFSCNFLLSMSTYPTTSNQNWLDGGYTTYILFKQKIDRQNFEKKLERLVFEKVGPQAKAVFGISMQDFFAKGNRYGYFLQPLTSIYLYSQAKYNIELNTEWGNVRTSSISYTYIFLAIGVFILLIAIFNFMNLATAKSESRSKEVGIRKTLGSDRPKLVWQFITESTITCLFSVIVSIGLIKLFLPVFNGFIGRELKLEIFNNFYTLPLLLLFTIIVGVLAGSYPAFYLSSFQPSHILKNRSGSRKNNLRSALVITQFTISITLIISTVIIRSQLNYVLNKDLGFANDQLIAINNASAIKNKIEAFKQTIASNPNVVSSTNSSIMFQSGIPGSSFQLENMPTTEFKSCQYLDVDYDFAKTYMLRLSSGRFFSQDYSTDTSAAIINESAARVFGGGNLLGKIVYRIRTQPRISVPYRIVGIVKDFNYESLHQVVRPLIMHIGPVTQAANFLAIRIKTKDYASTINYIKETWRQFAGSRSVLCLVLNDKLADLYKNELRIKTVTTAFSFLAIFIACLGLFGLVSFVTQMKVKEIGIRKVLGASVTEIVLLLSKEFTKWVLLANIIAWPIAYYIMQNWLQNFAYRTEINWLIFIISGVAALMIAFVTVSTQTVKAALANPAKSIRYE